MDNNADDTLILTIVIIMHSRVTNFNLNSRQYDIFNNVRLLCKSGGFDDYSTSVIDEFLLFSSLQKVFTKDLDMSTYDILQEHLQQQPQDKAGILVDNIRYDKLLSVTDGQTETFWDYIDPTRYVQGVYLLSIHKGKKLIYPPREDKKNINFLKLSDLHILANLFKTKVPNIEEESTVIPDKTIFIKEEDDVKNNNSLTEEKKEEEIKNIRQTFYNHLYNFELTLKEGNIKIIKLSKLIELIKIIIGENCFINVLDYSCNSLSNYIPDEQKKLKENALYNDVEMGIKRNPLLGGKNKKGKRKTKNKSKRKKRKRRKRRTRKK